MPSASLAPLRPAHCPGQKSSRTSVPGAAEAKEPCDSYELGARLHHGGIRGFELPTPGSIQAPQARTDRVTPVCRAPLPACYPDLRSTPTGRATQICGTRPLGVLHRSAEHGHWACYTDLRNPPTGRVTQICCTGPPGVLHRSAAFAGRACYIDLPNSIVQVSPPSAGRFTGRHRGAMLTLLPMR